MKDGILQSDSSVKASLLNEQFVSVFTNEDTSSSPTWAHHVILRGARFYHHHRSGVRKLLAKVKPHSATGPDNIPGAEELASPLSLLFQASLNQGPRGNSRTFHLSLRKATDTSFYRPISLTSIICKIMEHIIHNQIMHHLDSHGLIIDRPKQFALLRVPVTLYYD